MYNKLSKLPILHHLITECHVTEQRMWLQYGERIDSFSVSLLHTYNLNLQSLLIFKKKSTCTAGQDYAKVDQTTETLSE